MHVVDNFIFAKVLLFYEPIYLFLAKIICNAAFSNLNDELRAGSVVIRYIYKHVFTLCVNRRSNGGDY